MHSFLTCSAAASLCHTGTVKGETKCPGMYCTSLGRLRHLCEPESIGKCRVIMHPRSAQTAKTACFSIQAFYPAFKTQFKYLFFSPAGPTGQTQNEFLPSEHSHSTVIISLTQSESCYMMIDSLPGFCSSPVRRGGEYDTNTYAASSAH